MLAISEGVDGVDARLDATGALEIEIGGGSSHLIRKLFDELPVIAREETLDARNVLAIFIRRNPPAAGAGS